MVSLISQIAAYIHPNLFVQMPDQFDAFLNPKNASEKKSKKKLLRHLLVNLKNVRVLAPPMLSSIGLWRQCQLLVFPPIQTSNGASPVFRKARAPQRRYPGLGLQNDQYSGIALRDASTTVTRRALD